LLDDLEPRLLRDAREERLLGEQVGLRRDHELHAPLVALLKLGSIHVAHGRRSASSARAIASSWRRSSSPSGPLNSRGGVAAGRAGIFAPPRSTRARTRAAPPRASATRAVAERGPAGGGAGGGGTRAAATVAGATGRSSASEGAGATRAGGAGRAGRGATGAAVPPAGAAAPEAAGAAASAGSGT